MKICVCGGGHLGHVCAGVLSSHPDVDLNILSSKPMAWGDTIRVTDLYSREYLGKVSMVTDNPQQAIDGVDVILLCLPGYALESTLLSIKPYLRKRQIVGSIVSSTGFFFIAHEILGSEVKLFGFQRTPFIARLSEYGHSANLLGYKKDLKMAVENICNLGEFCRIIENLFLTPITLLNNFYEASLTNSNPILHTGRLYSMWKNWSGERYERNIYFYKEWTDEASEIIIAMDNEFMSLIDKLPVNKSNIPSLLDYYDSSDAASLTNKIKSIPAFQSIMAPMREIDGGWIPDFGSRYFIEDFPYGLKYIKDLYENYDCPPSNMISEIYNWGARMCVFNEKSK